MLDMPIHFFIGMYANVHVHFLETLLAERAEAIEERLDDPEAAAVVREELGEVGADAAAFLRLTNLDLQVICNTYLHSREGGLREEIDRSRELRGSVEELDGTSAAVESRSAEIATLTDEQAENSGRIAISAATLSASIEEVAAVTEEQATSTEEIASMIDETTDLSEKADRIASTNDTQRERIEGITAAVEVLRDAEERNDGGTKPNT